MRLTPHAALIYIGLMEIGSTHGEAPLQNVGTVEIGCSKRDTERRIARIAALGWYSWQRRQLCPVGYGSGLAVVDRLRPQPSAGLLGCHLRCFELLLVLGVVLLYS